MPTLNAFLRNSRELSLVLGVVLILIVLFSPPATISLPIKLLMFVIIDGWALVIEGVIGGFR